MAAAGASSGRIALRNATEKSLAFSKSLSATKPRVLSMQRDFLRSVPWIKREPPPQQPPKSQPSPPAHRPSQPLTARSASPGAYTVPLSEGRMRSLLTDAFRAKANVSDVTQVNRHIVMGRMELEETLMLWKGASHVNNWFEAQAERVETRGAPPTGFLENFFANKPDN